MQQHPTGKFPRLWRMSVAEEKLHQDLVWLQFAVTLKMKWSLHSLTETWKIKKGKPTLALLIFSQNQEAFSACCLSQCKASGAAQRAAWWKYWAKALLFYSSPTFSSITAGIRFTCSTELCNLYTFLCLKIPKLHRMSTEAIKDGAQTRLTACTRLWCCKKCLAETKI